MRFFTKWHFLTGFLLALLIVAPSVSFASTFSAEEEEVISSYRWPHCARHIVLYQQAGSEKRCGEGSLTQILAQSDDYGPFLCGVCQTCIDDGTCTLTDTMIVVGNVGNFLLGIVGALALLVFVIGGILILVSQGEKGRIDKGKKFIFASAIGVAITLGSVLILRTLLNVVTSGSPGTGSNAGVVCDDTNTGATCGVASVCSNGTCVGRCELQQTQALQTNANASYSCVDPEIYENATCLTGLCPGGSDNVCCDTNTGTNADLDALMNEVVP